MISIFKKEWKSYFHSPLAYIFIAVETLVIGFFFYLFNLYNGYPYFSYCLASMYPRLMSIALLPLLTMRIFSEEKHSKSDQMLLTAPVKLWDIVFGKFLAVAAVFGLENLIFCLFPLFIQLKGDYSYVKGDYLAILMYFLYGCVFIALGVFISSLTEYTAIAAVLSYVGVAVFIVYSAVYSIIPTTTTSQVVIGCFVIVAILALILYGVTKNSFSTAVLAIVGVVFTFVASRVNADWLTELYSAILEKLDYSEPLTDLVDNFVFSIPGLVLYITTIAAFLILTVQVLHKRRWN